MDALVKETHAGTYTQAVELGRHTLTGDEPEAVGGNDAGPSPYEFLLAALGTCTSITVRMYANLKKIPLDDIVVHLKHQKVHAEDCQNCDDPKSMIDHIDRMLEFKGNLTPEQRSKLLEIANKCPVHKTLTHAVSITTGLLK